MIGCSLTDRKSTVVSVVAIKFRDGAPKFRCGLPGLFEEGDGYPEIVGQAPV
jgi:hypothetical protein